MPENICQAEAAPGGGTWNRDGIILFAPSLSDGFYRVAAAGGKPQPVLKLDESKSERADLWPQFLPDGKHFVFYQQTESADTSGVYVGSLDQPETHRLFASQTNAVYSAASPDTPKSGYLLYIQERNLMAQQFNAGKAEIVDEPVTLANEIGAVNSLALAPDLGVHHRRAGVSGGGPAHPADGVDGPRGQTDLRCRRARDVGPSQGFAGRQPRHRRQDELRRQDRAPVAAGCQRSFGTDFRRTDARRFSGLVARRIARRLLRQAGRCVRYLHACRAAGLQAGTVIEERR